MFNSF